MLHPRRTSRRTLLRVAALGGGLAGAGLGNALPANAAVVLGPPDPAFASQIRGEFLTAWYAYKRLAWGRDEVHPLSGTGSDFFISGHPVGLTMVECLGTMFVMELDAELNTAVDWVVRNFNVNVNANMHVFESMIRLVGGLLSGYHATGNATLLSKARDLADRLLPAFTRSPTGMPYRYVNLQTGAVSGNVNNLAEIGTSIGEFGELSRVTGDPKYFNASKKALKAVYDRRSSLNLLGVNLNVETGAWQDNTATIDPPVDSFFEYLWDGYQLYGDADLRTWYDTLTAAVIARLGETYNGRLWFKTVDRATGALIHRNQSELSAFYAGLLGQSGRLAEGEAYHDSWAAVLAQHRLPPENINYTNFAINSSGYQLRPEYVDSALFLWLATGKEIYRDRARDMFGRQLAHCKVDNGYTIIDDIRPTPMTRGDLTPGYWYAENMKYYYLMFAGSPRFDYASNYLSTEGAVLRGLRAAPRGGVYRLVNRNSGKVLAVNGGSTADGATIVQATANGTAGQHWQLIQYGGYQLLVNAASGKALDVPGFSTTPGTQLVQWSSNAGNNQQWTVAQSGGYVALTDRHSGLCADVSGASTADNAPVIQWSPNGGTNQQWSLVAV